MTEEQETVLHLMARLIAHVEEMLESNRAYALSRTVRYELQYCVNVLPKPSVNRLQAKASDELLSRWLA